MEQVIRPWRVSYSGKISSDGFINTEEFGHSLIGSSKISVSIIHYIFEGRVPRGRYERKYQCISKPPVHGSIEIEQFITHAVLASTVVLQDPEVFRCAVEAYYELVWGWAKTLLTRKDVNHDQEMERLKENNEQNRAMMEIAMRAMNEQSRTHADSLEKMSKFHAHNLSNLAETNKKNSINYVMSVPD